MMLSQLAHHVGGTLIGNDVAIGSVSTDSRNIQPGDFFVALMGENFDGHLYIDQVREKGAVGAMVSSPVDASFPQICVEDTRIGLGQLGKSWLAQYQLKKIAITGSCGKTSVKEMVHAILSNEGDALATTGNLNNDIGVPLTLCRANELHKFAVIEMGANHSGEIAYSVSLVNPSIALVNNVAAAHLEGFGDIEQVAKAKAEIYSTLDSSGTAIINIDDAYAPLFAQTAQAARQLTFSMTDRDADVFLERVSIDKACADVHVKSPLGNISFKLPLLGMHNVNNALAAISVTVAAGCSIGSIIDGLESLKPIKGRLYPVADIQSHRIIDDSYNANPSSIKAAIDFLSLSSADGCLVLGCMGELGDESETLHQSIGLYAAQKGIKTLFVLGPYAGHYKQGYESIQSAGNVCVVAENYHAIAADLMKTHREKWVLIKGSRSAHMENVIVELVQMNMQYNEETN